MSEKFTESKLYEMKEAARPLMEWLAKNAGPHCKAHVDGYSVEIMDGVAKVNRDYIGSRPSEVL